MKIIATRVAQLLEAPLNETGLIDSLKILQEKVSISKVNSCQAFFSRDGFWWLVTIFKCPKTSSALCRPSLLNHHLDGVRFVIVFKRPVNGPRPSLSKEIPTTRL